MQYRVFTPSPPFFRTASHALATTVGGLVWIGLLGICLSSARGGDPLNVVLFVVDDLGWVDNDLDYSQLSSQHRGDTDAFFETPHLRDMASAGLTLTQAYTSSPVCSPTRASLMLGQSPATHRVSQFIGGPDTPGFSYLRSLPTAPTTLAESFLGAGYQTGFAGKWHLGSFPTQHGFQQNFGGGSQGLPSTWFANANGGFPWATGLPEDGPAFAGEYLTDRLTRDSVDFIQSAVAASQPFFLDLSHYGVHVPFAAPQQLVTKYSNKLANGSYAKFNDLTPSQRAEVATYAAMVEAVDSSLGAVRAALDTAGVADNTLFAFASDNGGLAIPDFGNFATDDMNGPLRNGKGTVYEGGIRTPLVISGPGIASGVSDLPIISHDLFPTLLTAAGVPLPSQPRDGVDHAAFLLGGAPPDRGDKPVVVHYPHYSNQDGRPTGALIDGDWKLIQNYEHGGLELFDLENDLSESTDIELGQLRRAERMRSALHQFLQDTEAQVPRLLSRAFPVDPLDAGNPLAVRNGSFEFDVLPDNTSGDPANPAARIPTGWSWVNGVVLRNGGVANPDSGSLFGPDFPDTDGPGANGAMDGQQIFYLGSLVDVDGNDVTGQLVGIEQQLDAVLQSDAKYTIRFAAGARTDQTVFVDGLVRLLAGDTILAEYETPQDPRGLFRELQLIYNYDPIHAELLGQPLGIQLLRDTDGGKVSYDNVRFYQSKLVVDCDFDANGVCNLDDIDALVNEIAAMTDDPVFDLNGDGTVDLGDRDRWLSEAGIANLPSQNPYLLGDANLDGFVDGQDFIIWNGHKFSQTTAWSRGNFNGDDFIDGQDFIAWNNNKFQSSATVAVPEPATGSMWLAVTALSFCLMRRSR